MHLGYAIGVYKVASIVLKTVKQHSTEILMTFSGEKSLFDRLSILSYFSHLFPFC